MSKIVFHLNCLEQGGAERVVSNLANQFARENDEVIVTTQWQSENEFALDRKVRRVHVGLRPCDEKKGRLGKFWLRIRYFRDFLKKEKPDIVIAFAQKANYRALMSTIGMKLPVIISVRTDPVGHYDSLADKIQIPLLFPRAAGCVFQTEGQKEFFPEYLQKKSCIILNPVHEKYFHAPKQPSRQKRVVQSGRLVDFKNQPMLIEAFLKVHKKHPDYELRIYGGDSFDGTKEILEKLIRDNHAEAYIRLMGASDSLEKQLPEAEVYAFSSDWEGLPNALLEAMALGLPIVATDCPCGGPRTVISHEKDGLLVPVKDAGAMAEGICRLIEDRELAERLGRNARKIRERVNGQAITKQWRDYIDEVIAGY
ncbi:N-acetylgalactosamine-N,N'-diacetylbacillosaminyl-diphospho-undecaprenol 4-alpha-N-acetylgalactosaminyltransferase [Lachnospiraceae bacterium]|nr:N-acetylgalactosamine-N,N'-diacetylbacillosaminyl-diphospho-undecaprenol 4-alpha-N-acetylgalactosaminyltransferase [Lachnospiraceae bacterium]